MIHLHTRSMYSLLAGMLRPEQIAVLAKERGMEAAVLTDLDTMAGTMAFVHACRKLDIRPITGLETVLDDLRFVFLPRNDAGLQQLYHFVTEKQDTMISLKSARNLLEDCICILTGVEDDLENAINVEDADKVCQILDKVLSTGDFYLAEAKMDAGLRKGRQLWLDNLRNAAGMKDGRQHIRPAAMSYVLYADKNDVEALKVLHAIDQQVPLQAVVAGAVWNREFRTREEMTALYSKEAIENAEEIARSIQLTYDLPHSSLPDFRNRLDIDSRTYLNRLAKAGLNKRLNSKVPQNYRDRLEYELETINRMGFTDYFLIVYDMIRFARSAGMLVGPGRGSAAGSLTAWSLGITQLDPVADGLLFERFLNPERISMPDIDTDFPDDRREEVIQYLKDTYGPDHAAQISAFSNLKARQVIRDVAKVMQVPERLVSPVTRLIPNVPGITLQQVWNTVGQFSKLIQKTPQMMQVFQMACRLEGLPRHTTVHAAGVVLSNQPIEKVCPLVRLDAQTMATQFTMEFLEELGLIKIDVLGLRNLSIIKEILDMIEEREGKVIDIYQMPTNDPAAYALLSRADTLGVFQLEKEGIRQLLRRMKPCKFSDVAIVLALYRPGPMQEIDHYLENRAHPDRIQYLHPLLKPILEETFGIMIYQEQIMETAVALGGFTMSQADILRKAMGKKQAGVMEQYRQQFIAGAKEKGIREEDAVGIFSLMEQFAGYGFNKSHSYAYGRLAYAMAYLKANYPLYFYKSVLDGVLGNEVKSGQYLYECRARNVEVKGPDLRTSQDRVTLEGKGLRLPLTMIKGIGKAVMPKIQTVQENCRFDDVVDTIAWLWAAKVTEGQIRSLIDAGALDFFEYNRATLRENLGHILNYAHIVRVESEQVLFDYSIISSPTLVRVKENRLEKSRLEKEAFGFYLSEHPVAALRKGKYQNATPAARSEDVRGFVQMIGRISDIHTHKTKKGDLMAFVTLEDETGQTDLAIMPRMYQEKRELLMAGNLVFVQGKKDRPGSTLVSRITSIQLDTDIG